MITFEPLGTNDRHCDAFDNGIQAALFLHKLSPLLMFPSFNNEMDLITEHLKVSFVEELDVHWLLILSKLKTEHACTCSILSRDDLLHAIEQEALVGIGSFFVIFDRVDGDRPQTAALDTLLNYNLMRLPHQTLEKLFLLNKYLEVDDGHFIEGSIYFC